ncbi:MAG: ANTAR domain-containing protein [Proteobacteria bacterium]|nr:ANTAR domain-containing protein [Pseudomonadota bacterium]MBU1450286.1 ANTAR domain-containing protein [Pseudomonadota bacterium]MBU2468313.1 ANTAR domain-containing protein [Pseudomonadota bacterium]MBU2516058.1 ANTAR domain-containing protein [Pseudomonadota bacterium]
MEGIEFSQTFKVVLASAQAEEVAGISRCLRALGHAVAGVAGDGRAACRLHHELQPDLAILAARLPGLDGMEVARRMHERRPLPVIIIASHGQTHPAGAAGPLQISAYISPPWEPSLIGPAMAMAWQNHHRLRCLEGRVEQLSQNLSQRKSIERAKGVIMEQRGLSLAQAQQCLEQEARRQGVGLLQVALDVISAQEMMANKNQAR